MGLWMASVQSDYRDVLRVRLPNGLSAGKGLLALFVPILRDYLRVILTNGLRHYKRRLLERVLK